jgi:hypothetical protein
VEEAYKDGGIPLHDKKAMDQLRSALKSIIAQVGKSILSGKFNLTQVAFPIWCMVPQTILQVIGGVAGPVSPHLNLAAQSADPVQRMKHVIVSSVAFIQPCNQWGKPLNPILGETFQAYLPDGSLVSVE